MMYREVKANRFVNYMRETWKNKITAIALILAGMIPVWIDRDGTALLFFACIALPTFFAKKNWMMW